MPDCESLLRCFTSNRSARAARSHATSGLRIWTATILNYSLSRLFLIVLVAAFISQSGRAQTPGPINQRIIHESWTFKDGAPEQARTLAQTTDGYLWVGAAAGLFRFDGLRFELFRSPFGDRLQSTNVSALFAPRTGGLWVGYMFGGFSFIKDGRVKNFPENTGTVYGFAQDSHGAIWAATPGGAAQRAGLWRFDGFSWRYTGKEWDAPEQPTSQLGFDRDGILWVLSGFQGTQLSFLPPDSRKLRKAADTSQVYAFTWDADHFVATARERPLETSPGIKWETSLPAYPILRQNSEQILDRANSVWLFPVGQPFVLRHVAGEPLPDAVINSSRSNSEVHDINTHDLARLVDKEGSVWIADQSGLHRFSYSPLVQQELPKWPGPIFTLAPDEEGVVWASAGDGLEVTTIYRVAAAKAKVQKRLGDASRIAYRAPDKTFWFGGGGGLWHLVDRSLTKVEFPEEMADRGRFLTTITHDGTGGIWVSFAGPGLYHLKDGVWTKYGAPRGQPVPEPMRSACPASGVVIAFTDPLARVWFGCTQSRLALLQGNRVQTFGPKEGVQVGNVTAIQGKGLEIWIGGEFGLQQFEGGRFRTIQALDKESLRGISGIVETANGDLWLNGLGGIVHIRRAEIQQALNNPTYQVSGERFDRRAGLPGLPSQLASMPTALEGTDGRLWFTVNNGVVWLDPTQASNKIPPPQVTIESASADDKGYQLDSAIRFPAHTSSVQISYAAVSLKNPEAIRYRYKLREIDQDWHEAGTSRFVSYRNLPPGSYHFVVAASDTNGLWSENNNAIAEFTILPAFYQTRWFRALCAAALFALLLAAYQLRVRQLRRQFDLTLEARVGERTRIARDLHDTLLQGAHGVLLRFQTVSQLLPDRPLEAKDKLDSAIEQTAEFITEARDEVQGLRASTVETNDLAMAISTLGEELAADSKNRPVAFDVAVEGEPRHLHPILRDETYKIAAEALRNAFRHANPQRIEVEIRYDHAQFRLRVRDDGKGIDPAILSSQAMEGHYGLHGMRERATLIGGKLTVWSAVDAGTEVELRIPASTAYGKSERSSWFARKSAGKMKA